LISYIPVFKKYRTDDDFIKNYWVSDQQLNDFIVYSSAIIKEMDSRELLESKPNIKKLLKAYMARFMWGDTAYYRVVNNNDPAVVKAVDILNP
jgi:carboxyl-terminal processing protease